MSIAAVRGLWWRPGRTDARPRSGQRRLSGTFLPFIDLNLYQLARQAIKRKRPAFDRNVVELAPGSIIVCNAIVLVAEMLRIAQF